MARTVPGYGAQIEPIFDDKFGVRAVKVVDGGTGYDISNPPRLTVDGCGTPTTEALLYPIIDNLSGKIVHVRVLERGLGYDPLRLQIIPAQDTPTVIQSFDINKIWQTHPNSPTTGLFTVDSDRLTIQSDNHPKPTPLIEERAPGGGSGGALAQYTPSAINYNPTTGLMEMTIGSHSYTTGDSIKIGTDSLTFTCALDDHGTDHTYPRATDPVAGVAIPILSTTSTTITVQVLGVAPATNTSAHTFKSATFGAVTSGGSLVDRSFNQTYIYRGGKDAPNPNTREEQNNKAIGIMANGVQLHTPEWGQAGNPTPGFAIDAVKYNYIKNNRSSDAVIDSNTYYYQSSRLISEFAEDNGVFDWGKIKQFTWNIKTEFDNLMLEVENVSQELALVEVGRTLDVIGGSGKAEIAKVVKNNLDAITHVYIRNVTGSFDEDNVLLGSTGFSFRIAEPPTELTNGVFYIDFGVDAEEFGPFVSGQYYFSPENIKVQRNYLIKWNQTESSNQPSELHPHGHPMQFSTTQDGLLNGGTLYYNSTGVTEAPSTDYENEFQPLFIMNGDESSRIYYYCKYHRYMSGYEGHEGYMTLDTEIDNDPPVNDYYITDYYQSDNSDPNTIDYSRHADGHSKILGMAFDGYPIYGPYGYDLRGTSVLGTTQVLSEYGGLFYQVGNGYPTTNNGPGTGTGTGCIIDVTAIGTYQPGGILTIRIAEGGSGYAIGDKIRILHKYDGAWISQSFVSGQGANANRTEGVYGDVDDGNEFTVQASWTSANGVGGKPKITVAADGSISGFTMGGNGSEAVPGPDGNMGYNYIDDEQITIPGNLIGGSTPADDLVVKAAWVTDDDSGIAEITAVGNGLKREVTGFRYRVGDELAGARPDVVTEETITYAVTVANGEFNIDGSTVPFLSLWRGKTYVFQQNDSSNDNEQLLISTTDDGWHAGTPPDTTYLFEGPGITYWLEGSEVTYSAYISGFNAATAREIRFKVPVSAPLALYTFGYTTSGIGIRTVQDGYVIGDLVQDYIWDSSIGTLDEYNGKFAVTPEYPNGTYAYFLTENGSGIPTYPYAIGPRFYGTPLFEGDAVPAQPDTFPAGAQGNIVLNTDGTVSYVKMTQKGDNYFGAATARILGGEGTGATGTPTVQTVTGLSLLQGGRDYATPPTLIFEGGGGQGAQGAAEIDTLGKVKNIQIVDDGDYYQEPPYILITGGGGIGAKATAQVAQGKISSITVTDPGSGYVDQPKVIFTKLVNLKRKSRARQAYNSVAGFLTGLVKNVGMSDVEIYVDSTDAFPGSGELILNKETITYTAKSRGKFSGLTRGVNFNYDQRVILDGGQIDQDGISTYKFNVGDRVIRKIENSANKVAKVYDWDPTTRELLVTFEVDELAFIDGGIPSTEDAIVQFDAGVAASAPGGFNPHVLLDDLGGDGIIQLTDPISLMIDKKFEDDDELDGAGDGIIDLVNSGTDYENQINLDGGMFFSLYGIEETVGGQNTTLFQVGDQVKDGSLPFKYATISGAGTLTDGVPHSALIKLYLDPDLSNGLNFGVNEIVTGSTSGIRATVVSWDPVESVLIVQDIIPFNTGNVNVGISGYLYEFSYNSTITDFIIQNMGTNYTAVPTVTVENVGDIQATGTVNMTTAGDQVSSITIVNGGYGINQTIDNTYNTHPTITFVNAVGDSTGGNAAAQAVLGGEDIMGNSGATYRLKRIEYSSQLRS